MSTKSCLLLGCLILAAMCSSISAQSVVTATLESRFLLLDKPFNNLDTERRIHSSTTECTCDHLRAPIADIVVFRIVNQSSLDNGEDSCCLHGNHPTQLMVKVDIKAKWLEVTGETFKFRSLLIRHGGFFFRDANHNPTWRLAIPRHFTHSQMVTYGNLLFNQVKNFLIAAQR